MCDYDENFVCFHVGGGDGLLNLYLHLDGDRAIAREYGDNDVNGGCEYNGGIGDGDSAYSPPAKGLPHLCLWGSFGVNMPQQAVLQALLHRLSPAKAGSIHKVDSACLSCLSSWDGSQNTSRCRSVVRDGGAVNVHVELAFAPISVPPHVPTALTSSWLARHRDVSVADEVHIHGGAAGGADAGLKWVKGWWSGGVVGDLCPVWLALTEPPGDIKKMLEFWRCIHRTMILVVPCCVLVV